MTDLLRSLQSAGWTLLGKDEYERGSADPFSRRDTGALIELAFHAFGGLGRRTDRVHDILYCEVKGTKQELYFDKRSNPEWRSSVARFVASVGAEMAGQDGSS